MREDLDGNPLDVLARWVDEAASQPLPLPNALTLATVETDGVPHARTVLVTGFDATSLWFHTSTPTPKTTDIAARPHVAGVFLWTTLGRQIQLQGTATELDPALSRAAFPTRPQQLRRVAWAYEALLPGLAAPDFAVEPGAVERAFDAVADPEQMPPSWTTIRVVPTRMEFWQAGTDTTPAAKTRFVHDAGTWRHFPVLP